MDSETTNTANFDGIKILYNSFGQGSKALVFIHGWTCSSDQFHGQAPLYKKYRSLLIDLPGHGRSDAPENVDYSIEFFARAIVAVLGQEGIEKVVLSKS